MLEQAIAREPGHRQLAPVHGGGEQRWRWASTAAITLVAAALFARIMAFPVQHDEQFYVPAGVLFSLADFYDIIGFSHVPNLPMLLSALYGVFGTDHYLMVGRLVVAAAWAGAVAALLLIGRDYAGGRAATTAMVAALVFNASFLDATGMAATNNFVPIPFALFGTYCFLRGAYRAVPSPEWAMASGCLLALAVGFKANYVATLPPFAIAALLVPADVPWRVRLRRLFLPLLAGGLLGGLPTLIFLASDPAGFIAHTVHFHRGPQLGYWRSTGEFELKAITPKQKYALANGIWLSGANAALAITIATSAVLAMARSTAGKRAFLLISWPVLLAASITVIAMAVSFVPTPAFPQYYTLPIPFAIVLLGLLHGACGHEIRSVLRPPLAAAIAICVLAGCALLLSTLPALVRPSQWTGFRVHAEARALAAAIPISTNDGAIATLAPLHALEGGLPIYAPWALGPFVYRATDWIPADDRRHFSRLVPPAQVPAMLRSTRPAAILLGFEGPLEQPLVRYAAANHYRPVPLRLTTVEGVSHPLLLVTDVSSPGEAPAVRPVPHPSDALLRPTVGRD